MKWAAIPMWLLFGLSVMLYVRAYSAASTSVLQAIRESSEEWRRTHIRHWMWRTSLPAAFGAAAAVLAVQASNGYLRPTTMSVLSSAGVAMGFGALTIPPHMLTLLILARSALGLYSTPSAGRATRVTLYPPFFDLYARVLAVGAVGGLAMALVELLMARMLAEDPSRIATGSVFLAILAALGYEYWRFLKREKTLTREDLLRILDGRPLSEVQVRMQQHPSLSRGSGRLQLVDAGGRILKEYRVSRVADAASAVQRLLTNCEPSTD